MKFDFETILKNLDENIYNYYSKYSNYKQKIIRSKHDNILEKIQYYDDENKLVLEGDLHTISYYYLNDEIWIWSWTNIFLDKNKKFLCKKILNYALDIDMNNKIEQNNLIDNLMINYLLNSKIKINQLEYELLMAFCLYITNSKIYIEEKTTNNEYFNITNNQKDKDMYVLYIINNIKEY